MFLERDTTTGRWIMRIDASLYKESECDYFVQQRLVNGRTPLNTDGSTTRDFKQEYGTAFHRGLQARALGRTFDEQLRLVADHYATVTVPDNEWRNIGHLVGNYVGYDGYWRTTGDMLIPRKHGGVVLAEKKFTYPLLRTEHVEVLLCGTIDLVADYMGSVVVVDHKTTAAWDAVGYLAEYQLSVQLMIYVWVWRALTGEHAKAMINAVFLGKSARGNFYKRSPAITFSEQQLTAVHTRLMRRVNDWVARIERGATDEPWERNYCACAKHYGDKVFPCIYTMACSQHSDADAAMVLDGYFTQRVYDPMEFGGNDK